MQFQHEIDSDDFSTKSSLTIICQRIIINDTAEEQ
jgi:hypothetical protein